MAQLETTSEWYRNAPWSDWNPASAPAVKKEPISFSITREKESTDGFFDVERLVAAGKLDIDVYFGWDYHSEYHLKHSRSFFTWLKDQGFTAPVASWDAMTHQTGAFTRTVKADGRTINVEVRFYFGKPGTATDPDTDAGGKVLEDLARGVNPKLNQLREFTRLSTLSQLRIDAYSKGTKNKKGRAISEYRRVRPRAYLSF